MRNWNTGGLSLSRPKQEQQNSVWQYLISGWKSNAYLRQVTETWPSSQWTCYFMAWDTDCGKRCKHLYDQTTNIWCQAVHWNALKSLNLKQVVTKATRTTKSSQTLVDHVINNIHEKITQFWLAEKGVQLFCNTSAKCVTRVQTCNTSANYKCFLIGWKQKRNQQEPIRLELF